MFATIEEAEQAARVVSRITRRRAEVWPEADLGIVVGFADESHCAPGYASWDELAMFLEQGYHPHPPEDERRKEKLSEARAHLTTAKYGPGVVVRDKAIVFALEALLEALT